MRIRDNKGSITMFVLVGVLFMSGFLLLSFGNNVNKSKIEQEQFSIISDIYSHKDGDENAYNRAYEALRKQKKQTLEASSAGTEDTSVLVLTKTFEDKIGNLKIYGSTAGLGDLIDDTTNINYGKYLIKIQLTNEDGSIQRTSDIYLSSKLEMSKLYYDYIDYKSKNVIRVKSGTSQIIETLSLTEDIYMYEDYTKIEILTEKTPSKIEVTYEGYTL